MGASDCLCSDPPNDPGCLLITDRTEDVDLDKEVRQVTGGSTSPVPSLAVTEGDFGIDSNQDSERATLQRYTMVLIHVCRVSVVYILYSCIILHIYTSRLLCNYLAMRVHVCCIYR